MNNMRRIKRMSRAKKNKPPAMNLVSLMDIFTILVFFLLVNSSSTEELPSPDILKLPDSVAEQKPEQTNIVMVTNDVILVKGRVVATVEEVLALEDPVIESIRDALLDDPVMLSTSEAASERSKEITIMGDRDIPFKVLKKVMASCTSAGYEKISLAVVQKASQAG